jgi:DNA-directed RNA polymerase subunit alpha
MQHVTLEELDFTVRTYNTLKRAGINSLGELSNLTESELMQVRNIARKSFDEVLSKLHEYGVTLSK